MTHFYTLYHLSICLNRLSHPEDEGSITPKRLVKQSNLQGVNTQTTTLIWTTTMKTWKIILYTKMSWVSVVGGLDFLQECRLCYRLVSMEGCVISAVIGHPSYGKLCVVCTWDGWTRIV